MVWSGLLCRPGTQPALPSSVPFQGKIFRPERCLGFLERSRVSSDLLEAARRGRPRTKHREVHRRGVHYASRSALGIETTDQARAIPNFNGVPVECLFGPNHSRPIVIAVNNIRGTGDVTFARKNIQGLVRPAGPLSEVLLPCLRGSRAQDDPNPTKEYYPPRLPAN
jgi:hypothetical protein